MLNTEKEACWILDEAAATLSLAYNLVEKRKIKEIILTLQNELLALQDEIKSGVHSFDPATLDALVTRFDVDTNSVKSSGKLPAKLGTAALHLAQAKVRHAAAKVGLSNPWGINKLAFDNLNKLAGVLYALAGDEEGAT